MHASSGAENERMKLGIKFICLIAAMAVIHNSASAAEIDEKGPPAVRLPVFFATNRQAIGRRGVEESASLGPLKCGMSSITLPLESAWIEQDSNTLRDDMIGMGWTIDRSATTFVPEIEDRGYVAEGAKETIVEPPIYTDAFWKKLSEAVKNSRGNRLYVYIPGFASSGINSLYAAGVLSAHVEAPVVVFSWPSDGIAGAGPGEFVKGKGSFSRLNQEEKLIQDPQVLADLTKFMTEAQAKLKNAKLVMLAHSLGNRLMARYFEAKPKVKFAGVYFIAADVSKELFYRALPGLKSQSAHTAVFSNRQDRVLYVSSVKNILYGHVGKKLGLSKFDVPGIEFIDYEVVAEPRKFLTKSKHQLKHYLPFDQFGSIVRTGQPYNSEDSKTPLVLLKNSTIRQAESKKNFPGLPF